MALRREAAELRHDVRLSEWIPVLATRLWWITQLGHRVKQLLDVSDNVDFVPGVDLPTVLFQDDLGQHVVLDDCGDVPEERPLHRDDDFEISKRELRRPAWQQLLDVRVKGVEVPVGKRNASLRQANVDPSVGARHPRIWVIEVPVVRRSDSASTGVANSTRWVSGRCPPVSPN